MPWLSRFLPLIAFFALAGLLARGLTLDPTDLPRLVWASLSLNLICHY